MVAVYAPDAPFAGSILPRDIYLTTNRAGLVGEFLFGQDLIQSRENSAQLGAPAAVEALINNPPPPFYGDHRVELGAGAGLQTNIAATPAQTILLVAAVSASDATDQATSPATRHILHGATAAESGRLLATSDVDAGSVVLRSLMASTGGEISPAQVMPASRPYTAPRCICSRISGGAVGSKHAFDELKDGALVSHREAVTTAVRPVPTHGIVIGNSNTIGFGGDFQARVKHSLCLIWSRALSDAEVLAAYLEVRANLASMGVPS